MKRSESRALGPLFACVACAAVAAWRVSGLLVSPAARVVLKPADFPVAARSIPGYPIAAWWLDGAESLPPS